MSAYAVKFELMPVFLLFLKTKNCEYGYRKLPSKPRKIFIQTRSGSKFESLGSATLDCAELKT